MSTMPIYLHIFWHQHQPWYFKPESHYALMPWVRLHGVKDYYDIAWLSQEYPGWKQTINLVPSLLRQLRMYTEENATDQYLELSRKHPRELSPEEKLLALDFLFHGHAHQMIHPHPRYDELYHRVGNNREEAVMRYTDQDFIDLQVWHNLTWIDPVWRRNPHYPLLKLEEKQRGYSLEDKQVVLDFQKKILKEVLPIHQRLYQEGQIDLTCSPYYHPILPLLCDNSIATVSNPHDPVPQPPFANPADAETQIQRGLDYFENCFGFQPQGMWPSEGSVSDQTLALMVKNGVQYTATDENILFRSRLLNGRTPESREPLYQLHQAQTTHGPIDIIFRDHEISDLIGFVYQRMDAKEAAHDFIKRIKKAVAGWKHPAPPFINVILDGENCWEFYPNDGHDFLRYWIEGILEDPQIVPTTVPEYRKEYPAQPTLQSIFPGSWINNNFRIWIGHPEDNAAWHHLRQAREELVKHQDQLDDTTREKAWNQLYICEGSDWFWWYGDENQSNLDWLFDQIFREHLMYLYKLIDVQVPNSLYRSIKDLDSPELVDGGILYTIPNITGKKDGYYEWIGSRRIKSGHNGGAMHVATSNQYEVQIGRQETVLCFLIDLGEQLSAQVEQFSIIISKPIGKKIDILPSNPHTKVIKHIHSIEGCIDLSQEGIKTEQDFWFTFNTVFTDGKEVSIPSQNEIYIQSYTPTTASVYWFV